LVMAFSLVSGPSRVNTISQGHGVPWSKNVF
jgi:hypothetical protein